MNCLLSKSGDYSSLFYLGILIVHLSMIFLDILARLGGMFGGIQVSGL